MTLKPSLGILLVLGLLALVQLHFTASSGTSTSEFSILPNSNTPCPMRPCFTLSQVMDNPSNYFTSNTTVVFPPGHHEVSTEGQLVIQNVNNISLVGDNNDSTMIKCVGQFGLAFINITNLTVSRLSFSMCGAAMLNASLLPRKLFFETIFYFIRFTFSIPSFPSTFSIYLFNITNLTATKFGISHSKGMGLLGGNIFGVSSIQQAVFVNNTPNCEIVFLDGHSPAANPVLYITDSLFMLGTISGLSSANYRIAAGLNIIAIQTMYHVESYIRNVVTHGNTGNILLRPGCEDEIQMIQVNCTEGHIYSLAVSQGTCNSYMNNRSALIMENVNINRNAGTSFISQVTVNFHGSNTFTENDSTDSALSLRHCSVTFNGDTTFLQNKGRYGGAVYAEDTEIYFQGSVVFQENEGEYGGAVYAEDTEIYFQGSVVFQENEGEYGGALMLYQNVSVVVGQFAEVSFVRNYAQESGGAVCARNSKVMITSGQNLSFVENEGYDGGAMTLVDDSTIFLEANSSTTFIRNHAYHYGGAIYYVDDYIENFEPATKPSKCFYGIFITKLPAIRTTFENVLNHIMNYTDVEFYSNTADFAGTAIYGGWVDFCKFYIKYKMHIFHQHHIYQNVAFDSLFQFHQPTQQLSLISSNPTRICLCTNMSIPDCNITEYIIVAYPGETLKIPAVAVGQRFGTVPTTVHSSFELRSKSRLSALQYAQLVDVNCTNLLYTIHSSPNRTEAMKLAVKKHNIPEKKARKEALYQPKTALEILMTLSKNFDSVLREYMKLQFSELTVHIEVRTCPLGFVFNNKSQTCICHPQLQQLEIRCSIGTQTVYRRSPLWINATFLNETYTQVLVHNHCPFDYCNDGNIQLNMEHPDEQCALSRSGVLCGSCQQNLSHVLGSSNCKQCSSHFLLLIPVFIVAGIALVVFLMLLNLTVSVGTISGLIFYANIVRANQAIFFPQGTNNKFLSIFIAWLNLDLGIETCFYSALDAYAKTWLQFVFPVYIWIIVVLIIVSSHYSTTAAKLSGRNAVQVLATLFLLSYAKLLRITITAFSFTLLEYPDGSVKRIWLYDGNVEYLKGKHIALFVAALLLLVFISLPYTVALLFIQCLQYRSRYRILAWVRRLKPLFDAYTGPYKDKHRYWPGLLLVVRIVLFLIFSVNVFGDPAISLLTIIVTTFCIYYFTITVGGVYKKNVLNNIEYSFFLNLGILSSATLFTTLTDRDQTAVVHTSVAIALATFMVITFYHILVRVTKEQQRQRFREWVISKLKTIKATVKGKNNQNNQNDQNNQNNHIRQANFNQFIELREPLLESAT